MHFGDEVGWAEGNKTLACMGPNALRPFQHTTEFQSQFGQVLNPFWEQVGRSCGQVGRSCGHVGRSWGPVSKSWVTLVGLAVKLAGLGAKVAGPGGI